MNPPRLYLPDSHDAARGFLSLSWRMLQGVVALACCASFGAGVACLAALIFGKV